MRSGSGQLAGWLAAFFVLYWTSVGCGDNECVAFGGNPSACESPGSSDASVGDADAWSSEWDADAVAGEASDAFEEARPPYYPPDASPQQVRALQAVNEYRAQVSLPLVDEHDKLNAAAQSHAVFLVKNCQKYAQTGLSPHQQSPDWEGFTGKLPWDRTKYFGYDESYAIAEVIAFVNNPDQAVKGWIDTLYHRLPLLDPGLVEIGYGNAATGSAKCAQSISRADVMDVAIGPVSDDVIVVYPPDGAKGVPRSFDGFESPQPPAPPNGFPSGYIITVQFSKKLGIKVLGHELVDENGRKLEHLFVAPFGDPENDVLKDPNAMGDLYLSMYAYDPLEATTTYTVRIELERGGKPLTLEWSFTTGNL